MRMSSHVASLETLSASWLAIGLFEGEPPSARVPHADTIARWIESKDLTGALGETVRFLGMGPDGGSILVYGLGKRSQFDSGAAYSAGLAAAKKLASKPRSTVAVALPDVMDSESTACALVEGLIVGMHGPGIRKKEPARHAFASLQVVGEPGGAMDVEALDRIVKRAEIVGNAVNLARELTNTPPSEKPPVTLAARSKAIAEGEGLAVEVWDESRLRQERFGGVIAVASGSKQPPAFVRISYRNADDAPVTALVGKGVTFDSGGLSLKPSASMEDMKCDMAGAATVLAVMQAAAKLKLAVNLDASFALTENLTGGGAMKLGDVLTIRNGTTVEVLNTDAEGRLILADVVSFVAESKPGRIVDLATLTGACMVALGPRIAGLFCNDDSLAQDILEACRRTGERACACLSTTTSTTRSRAKSPT